MERAISRSFTWKWHDKTLEEVSQPMANERQERDPDPEICVCWMVRRSTLLMAIAAHRAAQAKGDQPVGGPRDRVVQDLTALMDATRAGTGCGTCRMDLLALLAEYREREIATR